MSLAALRLLRIGQGSAAACTAAACLGMLGPLSERYSRQASAWSAGGAACNSTAAGEAGPAACRRWELSQQHQQRGFRAARTFGHTDSTAPLEERRRAHVQQHTVTAYEAIQVLTTA